MGGCLTTLCSPIRAEREFEMAAHPERGTHEVGELAVAGNRRLPEYRRAQMSCSW